MEKEKYWSRFSKDFNSKQEYVVGKDLTNMIKAKLETQKNLGNVLEFACGNGAYTDCIVKGAEKITATDYSEQMVEETKKVFYGNNKVSVEKADCHKTDYADESFDTILMANLIHVIDQPQDVLKESYRLLKPEGVILITCFTIDSMKLFDKLGLVYRFKKTFGKFPKSRTPFTLKSLIEFVETHNFMVQKAELIGVKTKSIFLRATKN